ncbi:transposase [Streptomyces sp. NPDC048278]|uniref:IS701 family transposase n=1 Tax=Streptomyces sp. NPDC048278 TaxID=3155809 RepID=UPI003421AB8E
MDHYSRTIFKSLRRIDQRNWAYAYLKGLLVTSGKKSVRRLATAVSQDPSAAQSLRQFVSLSPWDSEDVMEELTRWVAGHRPAPVWSIGRAVLPKRGDRSVGVHRYFDPSSRRTLNCQLGLGAFLCVGSAQIPVDWFLHLPAVWMHDTQRRRDARIPDSERYLPLWAHTLRLVDRLSERTDATSAIVLVDLSDEPDVGHLLRELAHRRRDFVIAIPPQLTVLQAGEGVAAGPVSARALALRGSQDMAVVPLADGQQPMTQLQSSLVRLPTGSQGRAGPLYRLFTEVARDRAPGTLWLTNLTHHTVAEVGAISGLQKGTMDVVASLEQDFGLQDFEGRSFLGWYHHMALVSAAYAFQRLHGRGSVPSHSTARQAR